MFCAASLLPAKLAFAGSTPVFVNEIHYDNTGTDAGEAIEIAGPAGTDLTGWSLVLYNGNGGAVYGTTALGGVIPDLGGGFGVVTVTYASNGIQNGSPDGVALVDASSTVVQFLSYEGSFAAVGGPANGMTSTDIGVFESGSGPVGNSLQLTGTGTAYEDFTWASEAANTFGAFNTGQAFSGQVGSTLVINEIDYDQPSTDTAEFIEIKNTGSVAVSLSGYTLELVNGTGGGAATYQTITLPDVVLAAGDYYVVCANAATVANCDLDVSPDTNLIQNGAPDAVGLRYVDTLVDAVSYEGDTGAPYTEGSGVGLEDSGIGSVGRCSDGSDTNQNNVDFVFAGTITPGAANTCAAPDPCTLPATAIYSIQGSGLTAAITGTVTTQGVVVGDYETPSGSGQIRGFYIQDPAGDGDPGTSDGIFVFNGNNDSVSLGDLVRVTGTAGEFQDQTQVSATSIVACGAGVVNPVDVTLPFPSADYLERFEGMLVRLPQTLYVTEHYQLGRFGQVVVSSGGRLQEPTDVVLPGPPALALRATNDLNRVIVDDATNVQNPDPIVFGRGGSPLSASNTLRGGDTATGIVGVMTYTWAGNSASGNAYRVRPIGALGGFVNFEAANARPDEAPAASGSVRVANVNLLNYFNTFAVNACTNGVGGTVTDCRGADDAAEFDRQRAKTIAAILGSHADVVGAIELENDGYGAASAIQDLVNGLNAASAPGTYTFIDVDAATGQVNALGTDAIKVGVVYKPARVIPAGTAALNSVAFVNGGDSEPRNRPALAQAFEVFGTGARFVVVVNHLKSKGGACDAPDAGDGQGNCNAVRTTAANELVNWLATDPTGAGDPDVLIIGDLNAYTKEDPVSAIEAAGYTNVIQTFGGDHAYSYVFDGQWGSLDHALASASLVAQVSGTAAWYINADEPSVLDYNTNFKSPGQVTSLYAPDEFRMADHNPLIVDLTPTVAVDAESSVNAGGYLELIASAGMGAGESGSHTNFAVSGKFQKRAPSPQGNVNVVIRRTEMDGPHVYQVKASSLLTLAVDRANARAMVIARATIEDVTDPAAPILVDAEATVRVTMADIGEPGIFADTVGITVWNASAALWFSSNWNGLTTVEQAIAGGNVQVR